MMRTAGFAKAVGGLGLGKVLGAGVLALALAAPISAQAETTELTPAEALAHSYRLLDQGRPDFALKLARALIARDPADFTPYLVASYAARDMGDYAGAEAYARDAQARAKTDAQRHDSAVALAQALASDGKRTRAQIALRRAIEVAPDPRAKARAIRDYKYVRARNPWSFAFDLGVSPTNNLNGGSLGGTYWLYGIIPVVNEALSGTEFRLGAKAERVVQENERARTVVGLSFGMREYDLSDSAHATDPTARGADYAYRGLEAYIARKQKAARGEWDGRLAFGHNDYAGASLSNYVHAEAGRTVMLGKGKSLRFGVMAEDQTRLDDDYRSAFVRGVSLDYSQQMAAGVLSLGVQIADTRSSAVTVDHLKQGISARYAFNQPVLGADLSLSAGFETREFGPMTVAPQGRTDRRITAGATAGLRKLDYMGFVPELSLNYERNRSNSVVYDSRELGLSLGLRSAF